MKNFFHDKKLEISVAATFIIIMLVFILTSPAVFLSYRIYFAVLTTLPVLIFVATSQVFVVAAGEIDLSFPSLLGIGALVFIHLAGANINLYVALICAIVATSFIGFVNGFLVSKLELSSLILTLGMNFFLRGLILVATQGIGRSALMLTDTVFSKMFVGRYLATFPTQMLWAIGWIALVWLLFYRHRFGGQVLFVGDNIYAAREIGINVNKIKILTFVLMGAACGFAGVLLVLINNYFQPTVGEGYLLIGLAAVFIGGTPSWGGRGTIFGAVIGALVLGFLEAGIIGAGLTGFYTRLFYGLILILALISHRFTGLKKF